MTVNSEPSQESSLDVNDNKGESYLSQPETRPDNTKLPTQDNYNTCKTKLSSCADLCDENHVDFENGFWFCNNRRSFIRHTTRHQSLRRSSTRSHDVSLFKRMCKVKPITAKDTKKELEWKLNIEDFQKKKQTKENIKSYPKALRSFYKSQDNLITSYEELSGTCKNFEEEKNLRSAEFYAKLSFFANLFLLAAKTAASVLSGSIAIISSLVDSVVDLASGIVIWMTSRSVRNCNYQKFPKGRKSLEPLAIIILSVIMALASLQLVNESVQKIIGLANNTKLPPTVDFVTIGIAGATVVVKLILYLICRKVESPTVKALAQDHRNDVFSNSLAILCGYLGSQEFQRETNVSFMCYVDPLGAIGICLYIAITWYITGKDQARILTGLTADSTLISKVTWLCLNHHYDVLYVRSVYAYHSGYNFVTEVDVVLSEDLTFKESCDIIDSLHESIERLADVERVHVKSNYEIRKKKLIEIKIG